MDPVNQDSVTIKKEPGAQEGEEGEMPFTEDDIKLSDIKEECLEPNENIEQLRQTVGEHIIETLKNYCLICYLIKSFVFHFTLIFVIC